MQPKTSQSGFSLVELLVAMAATLLVSGAIFGLLSGGQNAFRREPEITDMQQNLRMAMDVVMRDVGAAGTGIPTEFVTGITGQAPVQGAFIQVFTPGLDNGGACSRTGETGCPRPKRPTNNSEFTDDLEFFLSNSRCGAESICGYDGNASHIRTVNNSSCVQMGDVPIFFMADGTWTIRQVESTFDNRGGPGNCEQHSDHADISFRSGGQPPPDPTLNVPGGLCDPDGVGTITGQANCNPVFMLAAELVTYRVVRGTDGVPNLERRSSATSGGAYAGAFQVVARGIEDMQVQYATALNPNVFGVVWPSTTPRGAPTVVNGNYGTLVTQVRVTLSARTNVGNLTGESASADVNAGRFVRSSLTSTSAVRSALQHASREFVNDAAPPGPPQWN